MLSLDALRDAVATDTVDTVIVAFTDHYGRLHGKRLDAGFFLDEAVEHGSHGCDYLLTTDMEMEPVSGYEYANWELGYGDFHLVPDLSTMRIADWLESTAIVLSDLEHPHTHQPVPVAPRSMLRRQMDRAAEAGFSAKTASELEYFLFEDSYRSAAEAGYAGLTPVGWYSEDYHLFQGTREEFFNGAARRALRRSGIPVETSKGETGRGQHELNIRYADILDMADRHTLMKHAMKEIADELGISITFMAKPHDDDAGSSCHIHLSLWTGDEAAFPGDHDMGPFGASNEFRWFLGGWMAHVSELMPFYAPTVNSYKRFVDASWAPTRIAWSYDNRTAGFRIVGAGPSLRIENRIPGSDANPYLVYAATLAAGLDGIENRTEPPEMFSGDVYAAEHLPSVPSTLSDATDRFAESEWAREAFGAEAHDHYVHFFRSEQQAYESAVTDWERRRYFERI
ncbi:MAG: glutamine synthetase family protein [Actinomycetota bacterium]